MVTEGATERVVEFENPFGRTEESQQQEEERLPTKARFAGIEVFESQEV